MKKKKPKEKKKEEVCEIFEIEKDGKEKIKTVCGQEPAKHATKKEIKEYNKILRNIFIGVGLIILLIVGGYLMIDSIRNIEYRGVDFKVVNEHDLLFYNTIIPIYSEQGEHIADYNFYIRNDPRKLNEIPFKGKLDLRKNMVINMTEEFNCDGDGVIAIANLVRLYGVMGVKTIRDENATCDSKGRYMFLNIEPGEKTSIDQIGPACYILRVGDCEILKVTERFMIETFVYFNEKQQY